MTVGVRNFFRPLRLLFLFATMAITALILYDRPGKVFLLASHNHQRMLDVGRLDQRVATRHQAAQDSLHVVRRW